MGNNSGNSSNNENIDEQDENDTYITEAGVEVYTDGYPQEWMENFNEKITDWVEYCDTDSPDENLDEDEIEYVLNNMEDSEDVSDVVDGHLTRAEKAHHIINQLNDGSLKEGSILPDSARFRAYSRTRVATSEYCHNWGGQVVIYRTNNNTPHFKADEFCSSWSSEKESWVEQSNMKIDKITRYQLDNYQDKTSFNHAIQDELGSYANEFKASEMIFIDVSPAE